MAKFLTIQRTATMAERWVKAYREWSESDTEERFSPPEDVFYLAAWKTKVDRSSLSYSIMDFEDGSMAIRRDHEMMDTAWMVAAK